jgi:hypothetical protein
MVAAYRFLDRWEIPDATPDEVYTVLGDMPAYPAWWPQAFLEVDGEGGEPQPGKVNRVVSRGFLPYRIRWSSECVAAERPHRIATRLSGDFEGEGEWRIARLDGGVVAELDWRPRVAKPLVRNLTPVLSPLFRANHDWAMARGQARVGGEVARRRAAGQRGQTP